MVPRALRRPRQRTQPRHKERRPIMKRLLIALGIALLALAVGVGTATAADSSPGADQELGQLAGSLQGTPSADTAGGTAPGPPRAGRAPPPAPGRGGGA